MEMRGRGRDKAGGGGNWPHGFDISAVLMATPSAA